MLTPHSLGIKSVLEVGLKNMQQATQQAARGDKLAAHHLYRQAGTMFRRAQSLATMIPEPGERATAMKGTTTVLEEWAASGLENASKLSGMGATNFTAGKKSVALLAVAGALFLLNASRQQAQKFLPVALGALAVWVVVRRQRKPAVLPAHRDALQPQTPASSVQLEEEIHSILDQRPAISH